MRIHVLLISFVFLLGVLSGCSKKVDPGPPVTGTVTLDDQPLAGAEVKFIPIDTTKGFGGVAQTDASGKYTLKPARSIAPIETGKYKVTISRRRNPDGSEPDPKVPPINSPAVETLPAKYSNPTSTMLSATVAQSANTADFKLEAKKE